MRNDPRAVAPALGALGLVAQTLPGSPLEMPKRHGSETTVPGSDTTLESGEQRLTIKEAEEERQAKRQRLEQGYEQGVGAANSLPNAPSPNGLLALDPEQYQLLQNLLNLHQRPSPAK